MQPFQMALRASFEADFGAVFRGIKSQLNCHPDINSTNFMIGGLGDDRQDQGRRDGLPGDSAVQEAEEDSEGEGALQEEVAEIEERLHSGSARTGTASTET